MIFTTKEQSLIQSIGADESLNKSIQSHNSDFSRAGSRVSARDMLDIQLGLHKSYGPIKEELKEDYNDPHEQLMDTSGESFHTDNDKDVEKIQTTVEEINDQVKRKDAIDNSRKPGRTQNNPRFVIEKEADETISLVNRSMDDKLFLKAMGWMNDLEKAEKMIATPKKEMVEEHEHLVDVLNSPSHKDDKEEAKKQSKELKEYKKKSELDDLVDLIKAGVGSRGGKVIGRTISGHPIYDTRTRAKMERERKQSRAQSEHLTTVLRDRNNQQNPPVTARKSFVAAQGPGGIVFDFGPTTGNPVADNFAKALNMFPEPQQESIIRGQNESYSKALGEFVKLGESKFNAKNSEVSTNGDFHPEAKKSLTGSFDEQTVEALKKGHINVEEGFVPEANRGGTLNTSNEGPALTNKFNETEITMGGRVIKATSETDQALIEAMRKSFQDDDSSGTVISTQGVGVMIDAVTGKIVE